uniref:NADH-ubiquinone oxidoreductase chain 2 n=1 Tax=Hermissenda emurai TaxID=1840523 RepID=A0A6H0N1G1_9GAST|nr:NADH dehydrogenase subunit 2 [Hermissenda emurai]QIV24378.1 NADH dehydrogenase subunit 2 [Hermissenda emurai]
MLLLGSGNLFFYLLMIMGPLVAVSSSSWFVCWVGVELSFLGVIPFLVSESPQSISKEASMKYFCVQALGSGLLMCGGIFKFVLPANSDLVLLVGLLLKLGAFPLHFWVPSVIAGLDFFGLFLTLTWQKIAPFLFLINLLESSSWLQPYVLVIGGASAVVGAIIGLNQTMLGPLLGASSVSHTGWAMIGAVTGSLWVYFILYGLSLLFVVYFLKSKEYFLSSLTFLGLSGLPPFILFLGKWSVMKAAMFAGMPLWSLFLPVTGSLLSLFFYLKVFFSCFLEDKNTKVKTVFLVSSVFFVLSGCVLMVWF